MGEPSSEVMAAMELFTEATELLIMALQIAPGVNFLGSIERDNEPEIHFMLTVCSVPGGCGAMAEAEAMEKPKWMN